VFEFNYGDMMSNHDKLYQWWWGNNGPQDSNNSTICGLLEKLKPAFDAGIVSGSKGNKITASGYNYAVLKFLTKYCTIPPQVRNTFVSSSNNQNGNYGVWKNYLQEVSAVNKTSHSENCISSQRPVSNVVEKNTLKELIVYLQKIIENGGIDKKIIEDSIRILSAFGYQYDDNKFPALKATESFSDTIGAEPSNLAEALLWKLGKWQSYKGFVESFTNDDSVPTNQNVVFFAFARHLKDNINPIYDQHAIRGLWSVCGGITADERQKCKVLLFDGENKWKQVGSGNVTIECYELFVRHINGLVSQANDVTNRLIDRLFMPLGQAIKKSTSSYDEFHQLCGWPANSW
jgi:hypothetical protein